VEATRIGALDFLEKPIGMQKLLAAVKKALERSARHAGGGLSLGAFARPGPLRDLKRRLDPGAGQEPAAAAAFRARRHCRTGGAHGTGRRQAMDRSGPRFQPLEYRSAAARGGRRAVVRRTGAADAAASRRTCCSPPNGSDRYSLRLVAATTHSSAELVAQGWEEAGLVRLFENRLGVPGLAELKDEVPDIAAHLPDATDGKRRDPAAAVFQALPSMPCASHAWDGGYAELKGAVKSLGADQPERGDRRRGCAAAAGAGRRTRRGAGSSGAGK